VADHGGPDDSQLQQVVDRALAKLPAERYQSAIEFAQALEGVARLPGEPRRQALEVSLLSRCPSGSAARNGEATETCLRALRPNGREAAVVGTGR
jgi:hypothetical protein